MTSFRSWWLCAFAFVLGPTALFAQTPPTEKGKPAREVPPLADSILTGPVTPIDLPSALRLAGVANPEIVLARERVVEALAVHQLAAAQLLPNLNAGTSVDIHRGPLQQSNGNILQVNRGALYVGLGAKAVGAGTVTIPGLSYNANLSEVIFNGLATRQLVAQRQNASEAVRNETLLRVAVAYLALLQAEGRRAVALQNRDELREVARVTANYANKGQGRPADADRAATELGLRNAEFLDSENDVLAASARLCQLLALDPSVRLHAAETYAVPASL